MILYTCTFLYQSPNPTYLKMVHSSPPRHDSISMYKYFLSLKVLKSFTMKGQSDSSIISFSDMICCCCRVSTIYELKRINIILLINIIICYYNYNYFEFPLCIYILPGSFSFVWAQKTFVLYLRLSVPAQPDRNLLLPT